MASTRGKRPVGYIFQASQNKKDLQKEEMAGKDAELATDRDIAHDTLAGAISTGLLAIITAALAFFTFRLWKDTGELVKESSKSSERQLRAYVGITGSDVHVSPVIDERDLYGHPTSISKYIVSVDAIIKNHGNTPANEINLSASWAIVAPADGGRPHASAYESGEHQGGTLMPDATLQAPLESRIQLMPDDYSEIFEKETKSLQVKGTIRYKDSFEKDRTTTFNWLVIPNNGKFATSLCAEGNKAT